MSTKKAPAKKAAKKVAAKKAAVKKAPAAKKAAKPRYVPPGKLAKKAAKEAAKKVATKTAAKAPAKAPAPAKKAPKAPPVKPASDKPKAPRSTAPINPANREKRNGVLHPAPGTIGGDLWEVCDKLQDQLGRPPARFEYRAEVAKLNAKREKPYDVNSESFQYFAWRKFHGIKGRATGLFPKRGTFELNTKETAPAPAKKAASVPAKPAAKVPAKKAAKKAAAAPKAPEAPPAPPSETPGVSSRLAGVSEAAAQSA